MIALSEMIERRLSIVGKRLGQQEAEQERQRDRQDDEAVDRGEALEALDRR